jgi:23S rRNA pseudouridine1911/1915/1917 synthase
VTEDRLDQRLRSRHPELSWRRIRSAIERGQVTVDGGVVREPAFEVLPSAVIVVDLTRQALPTARLELERLYEEDDVLVIDKPAGLLTIASRADARATEDTVLRRVQDYARRLHGRRAYAGVLHRLDRDTSGALAVALSRDAHSAGRELFAEHAFDRTYLAIVQGDPRVERGTIEAAISDSYVAGRRRIAGHGHRGRHAVTHYRVLERFGTASLLELILETGRQHQIRLHLKELGHPLLGEGVYVDESIAGGKRVDARRQMLHAWRLRFPHPLNRSTIAVEAPIPHDFDGLLARLRRRPRRGRAD